LSRIWVLIFLGGFFLVHVIIESREFYLGVIKAWCAFCRLFSHLLQLFMDNPNLFLAQKNFLLKPPTHMAALK
jgi:hypothetical protein